MALLFCVSAMTKKLSDDDKQWLKDHPEFHVAGKTSLGKERKRMRRRSVDIVRVPTFADKLDDFEAMNSMNED